MEDRDKIVDMEVHYESKWERFKFRCKKKKDKFINWVRYNPQEVAIGGSILIVVGDKVIRTIKKFKDLQPTQAELDRRWQETHVYDRSLGMHFTLRRPMTPSEQIAFARRKQQGELTGDILDSMKLLKK